jgi:phosphodiester glycosidase
MKRRQRLVLVTTLAVGHCCAAGRQIGGDPIRVEAAPAPRAPARAPAQLSAALCRPAPSTSAVVYRKRFLGLAAAHVVEVDLSLPDVRITVGVARGGVGRCERWGRILHRLRPTAAITGTYYDTATFIPVGTIVTNGVAVHQGLVGTALTFGAGNQVRFTRSRGAAAAPGVQTALRAGPRLVDEGRVSLMPAVEGFRDPGIFVRKPRAAVGLTKQNRLLLVTVPKPLYLREMARVMQALGAVNALCMDGGSSTGLYCAGRSYQVPQRVMTNVLMVYAGDTHRSF